MTFVQMTCWANDVWANDGCANDVWKNVVAFSIITLKNPLPMVPEPGSYNHCLKLK